MIPNLSLTLSFIRFWVIWSCVDILYPLGVFTCMVINMNLFWFLYMQLSCLQAFGMQMQADFCLFFSLCLLLCQQSVVHRCVNFFMSPQFHSTDQCIWFCVDTTLFLLPWLYDTAWNLGWWYLQQFFSSFRIVSALLRMVVVFVLFCFNFHMNLIFFQFLWRILLEFWWWLHWICKLILARKFHFHNRKSTNPWAWVAFPSSSVLFNFFLPCLKDFISKFQDVSWG